MAFLDPSQTEEQKNQTSGGSQNTLNSAPSTSGGVASGSSAGGVSASGSSYDAAAPTSGTGATGFQNLQSYLDANSGNQMAGQIAGKISDEANQANSGLQSAQQSFRGAVDQNTVSDDSANTQSVLSNPTGADTAATQKFQSQLNANYGGPTDSSQYGAYTTARSQGQDAYDRAQAAQTAGGRQSLLKNYFGSPNYTSGEQALDSALVGNDKSGALESVQSQVQNLPAQFQQAGQDLNSYAQKGATSTAAARLAARNALGVDDAGNLLTTDPTTGKALTADQYGNPQYYGGTYGTGIGAIENAANARSSQMNATAPKTFSDISTALANHNLSGLSPDEASIVSSLKDFNGSLYGVNPTDFLTPGSTSTPATAATADEAAKLAALSSIAGTPNTFTNATEAGTSTPVAFNAQGFQSALQGAKAKSAADVDSIQNQIAQLRAQQQTYVNNPKVSVSQIQATDDAISNLQSQLAAANKAAGPTYNFATGSSPMDSVLGNYFRVRG